jgi:hypothetical protein
MSFVYDVLITKSPNQIKRFPPDYDNGARVDHYEIELRSMPADGEDEEEEDDESKSSIQQSPHNSTDRLRRNIKHKNVKQTERFILGLEPLMHYRIKIRAHNDFGYSNWSEPLRHACPHDGVRVIEFGGDWVHIIYIYILSFTSILY